MSNEGLKMINNLKKIRLENGHSMRALASLCGITPTAIHGIELGSAPRLSTAYAISTGLGVTVYEIWPNCFRAVEETVTRITSLKKED